MNVLDYAGYLGLGLMVLPFVGLLLWVIATIVRAAWNESPTTGGRWALAGLMAVMSGAVLYLIAVALGASV